MNILYPKNKIQFQGVILFLAIAVLGGLYIRFTWIRIEKDQSENVLQIARNIEGLLPKEGLKALEEKPEDINNPQYQVIKSALKEIFVTVLKENSFMEFMQAQGKVGGQHKFPRVLKGKMLEDWQQFLLHEKKIAGRD